MTCRFNPLPVQEDRENHLDETGWVGKRGQTQNLNLGFLSFPWFRSGCGFSATKNLVGTILATTMNPVRKESHLTWCEVSGLINCRNKDSLGIMAGLVTILKK